MSLPTKPKKEPKGSSITLRVRDNTYKQLKELAAAHNMSQAEVFEQLVTQEYERWSRKTVKK